jgi:hypothetical protein
MKAPPIRTFGARECNTSEEKLRRIEPDWWPCAPRT